MIAKIRLRVFRIYFLYLIHFIWWSDAADLRLKLKKIWDSEVSQSSTSNYLL